MRFIKMGGFFILLMLIFSVNGFAATNITVVTDAASLTNALSNTTGSNVKLGGNITYTTATAKDADIGVIVNGGNHVIDLNGYTIMYAYTDKYGNRSGITLSLKNGNLTVIGNGGMTGGWMGIECSGNFSTLTLKGGIYNGGSGAGIRIQQGSTIVHQATFIGGYRDVFLENGNLFNIGGKFDSIEHRNGAYSSNGVLKGNASINSVVNLGTLTIPSGSSVKVWEGGVLNVSGAVSGKERITLTRGIVAIDGKGQMVGNVSLGNDLTMKSLTIPASGELFVTDNATVKITESFTNNGKLMIMQNCEFLVTGEVIGTGDVRDEDAFGGIYYYDVKKTDWFYDFLIKLTFDNIISGYDNHTYKPNGDVSWGQALALVLKTTGLREVAPTGSHWASGYMDEAISLNAIETSVDLNQSITRAEIAELVTRLFKLTDIGNLTPFSDTDNRFAVMLFDSKIMMGSMKDEQRVFSPDSNITRAEMCAVITNIFNYNVPKP